MATHKHVLSILGVFVLSATAQAKMEGKAELQEIRGQILAPMPSKKVFFPWEGGTASDRYPNHEEDLKKACFADEEEYTAIQFETLKPWMESWKNKKFGNFLEVVDTNALRASDLGKSFVVDQKFPRFQTMKKNDGFKKTVTGAAAVKTLQSYVESFSKVEDLEILTFQVSSAQGQRDSDFEMKEAALQIRMDLRGQMKDKRVQDVVSARVEVKKQKDGEWKITGFLVDQWNRTEGKSQPAFHDSTAQLAGLTVYQRKEAIRRGGYALSLGDLSGEGKLDMVVGAMGDMSVFKGDGTGGFKKQNFPGLDGQTYVKSAVIADFSNSGRQDLLMIRFVPTGSTEGHSSDILLYKNEGGGKFSRVKMNKDETISDYAMPVAVADFNKDSFLDFYVGFPGAKDFTHLENLTHADNLKVQGMYWNTGKMNFKPDYLKELDPQNFGTFNHRQKLFPHSAVAADINGDGYPDLVVMDDRGNLSPTYLNNKDGSFTQVAERLNSATYEYGMGAAVGDFDGDGIPDLLMTNVNFVARDRLQKSCLANWDHSLFNNVSPGMKLLKGTKDGKFIDVTEAAGLSWAGEGLAGVEFVDYNGDGHPDIFVNNGLWSGTDRSEDLSSYFVRAEGTKVGGERALKEDNYSKFEFMKVLSTYQGSLFSSKPSKARPSMAGFQRKRLFRNDGKGHFVDVAYMEGVDSIADGYNVAKGDINGDGVVDLVLRNADPGTTDVHFSPVELFTNDNPEGNNWLKMSLEGTKSNRDAVGTKVTVQATQGKQYQELIANNGCIQSEKVLFFGVGKDNQVNIHVEWPSGKIQDFQNVKPGMIKVVEGQPNIIRTEPSNLKKMKSASTTEY